VLTSDGTFQKVVKRWERDYDGELIIVGVRGLPKVRMTVEHPVMVRSDGRKIDSVKEGVKRGRWNTYFKIIDKLQPIKEVRADKLNPAHLIGMPYTKTVVSKKNYEDDYLKLAGWYLSEGSLELTNTTARISIHLHEKELKDSKEIEQLLRNLIINTNNKRGINRKITNVVNGNKRMVRMGNVGLCKRLHDDFGSGAADKLIPADILWGDLEMGKKLLWGLIRGDGHRSKRGVSYSTISQDLAWGVFILLHRLKLYPTLRVIPPRGIHKLAYEVRIRNGKNASELCKIVGWKPYEYDKQINTYADDGGSVWRHIRSLETEKYTGKVYNLWVEGDHTYVVSCGAVHNCHPRDNIALSYIAEQVGMSHNIWEDLMSARDDYESWHAEIAEQTARDNEQDLYILGRAFKPETNIEAGSPSKLMSSFIEMGHYHEEDMDKLPVATYFIGTKHDRYKDYKFPSGSTVIDPFGIIEDMDGVTVRRLGRK
jgi:intein/homing endonuclease